MLTKTAAYLLRHLSIRVPWHDSGWDGRVCSSPADNMSCLVLKGIGPKRDDVVETKHCGKSLEVIPESERPCCVNERGFFIAPFEFRWDDNGDTELSCGVIVGTLSWLEIALRFCLNWQDHRF